MTMVTVIVCTLNRCQGLAKTLESVAASTLPDSVGWEVLVVDNNSTDQTREVVEDFCRRYPGRFRYLLEPQQGKSYALNAGIREARGEVLAFLDDDVTVELTWLQNLTAPLRHGQWAGAGGRTLPARTFLPPRWLVLEVPYCMGSPLFAHFDFSDKAGELYSPPYGTNMAFRKEMFEKYGGFRTDLGPSPDSQIPRPNEDTEFGRRVLAAGERLWYERSAVVYHPVPEDRLQKSYFLHWMFDYGRAIPREFGTERGICGIPGPYVTVLKYVTLVFPWRALRWAVTIHPGHRFYRKCRVWMTVGMIKEFYRLAHAHPQSGPGELADQPPSVCQHE